MIPIAELKKDQEFYRSLSSLVEVLKLIAAAQYQSLEKRLKTQQAYLSAVQDFFSWLDVQNVSHPFLRPQGELTAVVAITTDSGLLGGLNAQVITQALACWPQEQMRLIIVGRRGELYVEQRTLILANFPGISDDRRLDQALQLRDYLIEHLLKGSFNRIMIVHPRALTFTSQRIETVTLVPFASPGGRRASNIVLDDVILESRFDDIVEYLIYLWMGQKLFDMFGVSRLAEQAARFMHLENCSRRIRETEQKLKFQYFRARHEKIDQNMRELFAARIIQEH